MHTYVYVFDVPRVQPSGKIEVQIQKSYWLNMPYSESHIKNKLTEGLNASYVEVIDQSDGCGAKFSVIVVSDAFEGKPLLQRHRLVNAVLEEELKTIHAFSQKTLTPEQWEKQRS
ncbi:bolA-like protein 2 isoform X2 [Augochlora pura]